MEQFNQADTQSVAHPPASVVERVPSTADVSSLSWQEEKKKNNIAMTFTEWAFVIMYVVCRC